jgi:hypothetical protein
MKKCNQCNENLELEKFNNLKTSFDGKSNTCKECSKLYQRLNYFKYKSQKTKYSKQYYIKNKEYKQSYHKDLRKTNEHKEYQKEWRENNREKIIDWWLKNPNYMKEYQKGRIKVDSKYKLNKTIGNLIRDSFRKTCKGKFNKSKYTQEILGCTLEEFVKHLQSQFTEGMTLENHGEWEMDHIKPISLASTEEEIYKLNHYTNFQPLWKEDNRKKSNKY